MQAKKIRKGRLALLAVLLFILFFGIGNLFAHFFINNGSPLEINDPGAEESAKVLLLVGIDARNPQEPSRSDTIILAFLHPEENRIDLLSVPRDSRVAIPGEDSKRKINYAHARGDIELLRETLNQVFDIEIAGYVEIDFEGFTQIIDNLGGVEINVETPMSNPLEGIDLQPGLQRLNGYDALAYIRYRDEITADIGRIERQQKFLRALARQAVSFRTIIRSPVLVKDITNNLETDLTTGEILSLAKEFITQPQVNTYMVPGEPEKLNGGSYWVIDWPAAKELLEQMKNPLPQETDDTADDGRTENKLSTAEVPYAYSSFGILWF